MTFEEFFKKKRIDLAALQKAEPVLFSEFKTHFEQMGEKSFDHTKKYWFNKVRRQFLLPPEIKTEKVHIENSLAEQTVTENLTGAVQSSPSPKLAFVPRFKAANMSRPEDKKENSGNSPANENLDGKPAYKPRFNIKTIPPKPPEI